MTKTLISVILLCVAASALADPALRPAEGDYSIRGFALANGEVIPELKVGYRTLGAPTHDETGLITNAVLLLRGAGQGGEDFLSKEFADALFGPGQPLDALQYFLIIPDDIVKPGKPGDNSPVQFAHLTPWDLVLMQYRLVLEHLGVNHLRLILGNTTGGRQAWLWGSTHPYFVDALVVIDCVASQPRWTADAAHRAERRIDDDSYRLQMVESDQVAASPEAVRANTVAIFDEDALTPDQLAILQNDISRMRNGRYFTVRNDHARASGAISMVQKWKVVLPELLESSANQ